MEVNTFKAAPVVAVVSIYKTSGATGAAFHWQFADNTHKCTLDFCGGERSKSPPLKEHLVYSSKTNLSSYSIAHKEVFLE